MDKLADFLFTGDYAVDENDVLNYWAGLSKNRCVTCNSRYKLLALHLGMFRTARTLHMELLQLLALHKFVEAAQGASNLVLKRVVEDIYSMNPSRNEFGDRIGLAGFGDFRPLMIIPAIVDYILKGRQASGWMRTLQFRGGAWMVAAGKEVGQDPEEEFRKLRERSPRFSADLAMGLQVMQLASMQEFGFV